MTFSRNKLTKRLMKWTFFSYSLPAKPSKARVYVWRQLRKLGALSYQSFWILPSSPERINELKRLCENIKGFQGESLIIDGRVLSADQEERIRKIFVESRDEEYQELIHKCDEFFTEIQEEIAAQNFIFAEVEENEEELDKLRLWLKKIEKRDVLGAPKRKAALDMVKSCDRVFEDFARRVYEYQNTGQAKPVTNSKDDGLFSPEFVRPKKENPNLPRPTVAAGKKKP